MDLKVEIIKLAMVENVTLTQLAKYIEDKQQKPYSVQNLSTKLKKGTLNLNELSLILDKLNYDVHFEKQ